MSARTRPSACCSARTPRARQRSCSEWSWTAARAFWRTWATRPWVCSSNSSTRPLPHGYSRISTRPSVRGSSRWRAAERGREIQEILSYPPGTAGSLMDAQVSTFAVDCAVGTALERVRQLGTRRAMALVLRDEKRPLRGRGATAGRGRRRPRAIARRAPREHGRTSAGP